MSDKVIIRAALAETVAKVLTEDAEAHGMDLNEYVRKVLGEKAVELREKRKRPE